MNYKLYSWISMVSQFGGLFSVIIIISRSLGEQINFQNATSKYIRNLYFIKDEEMDLVRSTIIENTIRGSSSKRKMSKKKSISIDKKITHKIKL